MTWRRAVLITLAQALLIVVGVAPFLAMLLAIGSPKGSQVEKNLLIFGFIGIVLELFIFKVLLLKGKI